MPKQRQVYRVGLGKRHNLRYKITDKAEEWVKKCESACNGDEVIIK
jgi:hypothetical protein